MKTKRKSFGIIVFLIIAAMVVTPVSLLFAAGGVQVALPLSPGTAAEAANSPGQGLAVTPPAASTPGSGGETADTATPEQSQNDPAGEVAVSGDNPEPVADGTEGGEVTTAKAKSRKPVADSSFVAVAYIDKLPTSTSQKMSLDLSGRAMPENATYRTISFTLVDDGGTGATLTGSTFYAPSLGTAVLRASVANGLDGSLPFEQDFSIVVADSHPDILKEYSGNSFGVWRGSGSCSTQVKAKPGLFEVLVGDGDVLHAGSKLKVGGSGSTTKLTLSESYLRSLPNGRYSFTAQYTDGVAPDLVLVVKKGAAAGGGGGDGPSVAAANTKDGITIKMVVGLCIMFEMVLGAFLVLTLRKKSEYEKALENGLVSYGIGVSVV